ncbi:hypothetical protein M0R45_010795 [Rubus argutus]|uniref:Agenet-like domain-containing protein n=1 Tax=Rubus argutus TaxID=59490 RepID=A0AAW1Y8X5_RUBAR
MTFQRAKENAELQNQCYAHACIDCLQGDEVEVCCNSEGFLGSDWEAIIVVNMGTNYLVEYKDFVDEADESTPLRETVMATCPAPAATVATNYAV